jgi:hypothetical protein
MRTTASVCFVLFAAWSQRIVFAQATKPAKTVKLKLAKDDARSRRERVYSSSEFDPRNDSLPPNFKGHDIARVFEALVELKNTSEKSEFETTEQWHRRQDTIQQNSIIGSLNVSSTWVFQSDNIQSVYDADRQILHAYVPLHSVLTANGSDSAVRSIWSKFESRDSSYMGANGFGAVTEVTDTQYTIYHVAFENVHSFPTAEIKDSDSFSIRECIHASTSLGVAAAKAVKSQLSALIICRLTSPFTMSHYESESATFDHPYASHSYDNFVVAELLGVWIYDQASGIIYAKLSPDN